MAEWTCDGVPKDGKNYPDSKAHDSCINYSANCQRCGLPRSAMNPPRDRVNKLPPKVIVRIGVLLGSIIAIALFNGVSFSDRCPSGTKKVATECVDPYLTVHQGAIADGDSANTIIRRYRSAAELQQARSYLAIAIKDLNSIPESALVDP